ncbi:hypothetical protein CEP45_03910 [Mergibacter septicus]|uniref:SGNH/GDSL hydrolase family protein n=1 Tax=Mergibacter septicus TaxID=221402 RepID=UPI001C7979AD|nr:SGNH/GDSL hydrolase family protein [Mergibacter septicus]QDJ13047.1 hypothetical protein CEP45_03910 [Mergibacter septicus]
MKKFLLVLLGIILLSACSIAESTETPRLINYNHSVNQPWLKKLQQLNQGKAVKFRILQLGDSHTASDFFSGELRRKLQQHWGDAGIGWIYPNRVRGQVLERVKYSDNQAISLTSLRDKDQVEFPLGGITALSGNQDNHYSVTISPTKEDNQLKQITFSLRPLLVQQPLSIIDGKGSKFKIKPEQSGNWQYIQVEGKLPVTYSSNEGNLWQFGSINIENQSSGIVLSAMGINGSQLTEFKKWRENWTEDLAQTQADLIILAYGTNESLNQNLDLTNTEKAWRELIKEIRQTLPDAGILVISAPETLQKTQSSRQRCGVRTVSLDRIQQMQKRLAKEQKLLYWSWQAAMGGKCSMNKWIKQGLARQDGVHFTLKGYQKTADILATQLIKLAK